MKINVVNTVTRETDLVLPGGEFNANDVLCAAIIAHIYEFHGSTEICRTCDKRVLEAARKTDTLHAVAEGDYELDPFWKRVEGGVDFAPGIRNSWCTLLAREFCLDMYPSVKTALCAVTASTNGQELPAQFDNYVTFDWVKHMNPDPGASEADFNEAFAKAVEVARLVLDGMIAQDKEADEACNKRK